MEIVVVSGKGGTGKTTIAVALSELAKNVVKSDCDVDSPNLYLFYGGKDIKREDFCGEKKAVIDEGLCIKCGKCEEVCQFDAICSQTVDFYKCEGCGACTLVCPEKAIQLKDEKTAKISVAQTEKGIISTAQMKIGSEGSGKLVTELRKNAREFAREGMITIVDGSPGIGCPVISSITGADMVLIVTEPTQSGLLDLTRVGKLCKHFKLPTFVCINKYDINEEVSKKIEDFCNKNNITLVGKIPFDETVLNSINELKPIVCYSDSAANKAIRQMWEKICRYINL